jgi:hypothetical protein
MGTYPRTPAPSSHRYKILRRPPRPPSRPAPLHRGLPCHAPRPGPTARSPLHTCKPEHRRLTPHRATPEPSHPPSSPPALLEAQSATPSSSASRSRAAPPQAPNECRRPPLPRASELPAPRLREPLPRNLFRHILNGQLPYINQNGFCSILG